MNENFGIQLEDMVSLIDHYRKRKFDEDIQTIKLKHEGVESIASKLRTSFTDGLKGDDFDVRDGEFGSNK